MCQNLMTLQQLQLLVKQLLFVRTQECHPCVLYCIEMDQNKALKMEYIHYKMNVYLAKKIVSKWM